MILAYFAELAAAFAHVEATDSDGKTLTVDAAMERALSCLRDRKERGALVALIGNGGSASIVAHAQNDLVKAGGIRAIVFQDIPLLTAAANDCGYPSCYSLPMSVWLQRGDLVVIVSSSGASENLLWAASKARQIGCTVITCTGFRSSNPLRGVGDVNFYVPSFDYGHVELTHAALLHYMTDEAARA